MSGFSEVGQKPLAGEPLAHTGSIVATLRLGPGGRIVIPADMREVMGLKQGDAMLARLDGTELNLVTLAETVRQLQEMTSKYVPEGVSQVDLFIAERRAEAAKE